MVAQAVACGDGTIRRASAIRIGFGALEAQHGGASVSHLRGGRMSLLISSNQNHINQRFQYRQWILFL